MTESSFLAELSLKESSFAKVWNDSLSTSCLQDALATFDFLNNTVAKPDYDSLVENEQPDLELTAIQRKTEIR